MEGQKQKLSSLPLNHVAKVTATTLDSLIGKRLCSLGVCINDFIIIRSKSFLGGTLRAEVFRDSGFHVTLAIRSTEADTIMVQVE